MYVLQCEKNRRVFSVNFVFLRKKIHAFATVYEVPVFRRLERQNPEQMGVFGNQEHNILLKTE